MRLLLDTHTLIWWWAKGRQLPSRVLALLTASDTDVYVSSVCAWEMATKFRLGKLPEADLGIKSFASWVGRDGMVPLPITHEHALLAGSLQGPHADPFDRMLAAQSIVEGIAIASIDAKLDQFGCERIWS